MYLNGIHLLPFTPDSHLSEYSYIHPDATMVPLKEVILITNRVYYFEMPVEDFDRAIKFYETVFGWKVTKTDRPSGPYYSVITGDDNEDGINGSFFKKEEEWSTICNIIHVDDIDSCIENLQELGGEIVFPKVTINGVGYLAYFKDTEGNTFGIHEDDPDAHSDGGM